MADHPLDRWHQIVRSRDVSDLRDLLADDVVFYSPVVHTPQKGRQLTTLYLAAALQILGNGAFRYTREIIAASNAALEFETEIDFIHVNGIDLISWNRDGKLTEFKVMIRPLKAIAAVQQRMAAMLSASPGR